MEPHIVNLPAKSTEFQLQLTSRFAALECTDDDLNATTPMSTIRDTAVATAGSDMPTRPDKLSSGTKQLTEKWTQMKRGGTGVGNIRVHRDMQEYQAPHDRRNTGFQRERATGSPGERKGSEEHQTQAVPRKNIITLKEDDRTVTRDHNRINRRCEEFYSKLYDTRRPQDCYVVTGDISVQG